MAKKVSPKTKTKTASKKSLAKTKAGGKIKSKKVVKKTADKKMVRVKKEKENYLARWTTPAFVCGEGEIWMYRLSLIASAAMSVWSFYKQDFLAGATFGLLALVVAKYLFQKPADIECQIDLDGVKIGPLKKKEREAKKSAGEIIRKILSHETREKFYSFDEIESFEVAEKGTYPEDSWHNYVLKIKGKGMFFPHLEIPLADQDPVYIRELMVYFVPEKKGEEESVLGGGGVEEEEYVEVDYRNDK